MDVRAGLCFLMIGVMGATVATVGIIIHDRIRWLRRHRMMRCHRRGTVRKIARRGYRVEGLYGLEVRK